MVGRPESDLFAIAGLGNKMGFRVLVVWVWRRINLGEGIDDAELGGGGEEADFEGWFFGVVGVDVGEGVGEVSAFVETGEF